MACDSITTSDMDSWSVRCPVSTQPSMCLATFTVEDSVCDTFVNMNVSPTYVPSSASASLHLSLKP